MKAICLALLMLALAPTLAHAGDLFSCEKYPVLCDPKTFEGLDPDWKQKATLDIVDPAAMPSDEEWERRRQEALADPAVQDMQRWLMDQIRGCGGLDADGKPAFNLDDQNDPRVGALN